MKYNCVIQTADEEEVTIMIGKTKITGFANKGFDYSSGEKVNVEIEFFGDLIIKKNGIQEKKILYNGAYSYVICGILDVDDGLIKSEINFSIDRYYLYEYGYLDKEYVEIIVPRVDFYF